MRAVTGRIDPDEPCTFQLSGGTTGVPKVIPRTHNDYRYNTVAIAAHNAIDGDARLLVCLPIAHNFPLACPGIAGFFFAGRPVVLSTSTNPADLFALIDRHRITHLEMVPALVIRCLEDPALAHADLSSVRVINTGGQKFQTETKHRAEAAFRGPRSKRCSAWPKVSSSSAGSTTPTTLAGRPSVDRSDPTTRCCWSTTTADPCRRATWAS